jgi:hypothetical protein
MKKYSIAEIIATLPQKGNPVLNGRKVRSKVLYIAGTATANISPTGQLIEQKTLKEVGVTNFDGGNTLNKGRDLLVVGLRILFDTTADVTPKTASWKGEAPANFKNGELVISQDTNLFEGPIGPYAKYASSLSAEQEFKAVAPFLITSEVPFNIQVQLAAAAAANQAFRLELDCLEFMD